MQPELSIIYDQRLGNYTIKDGDVIISRDIKCELMSNKERQPLSCLLSKATNTPIEMTKGHEDSLSYLCALSFAGEFPSVDHINELYLSTIAVNLTRKILSNGSANVTSDVLNRPQVVLESDYSRECIDFKKCINLYAHVIATSSFVSTGRCDEHSILLSIILSQLTAPDVSICRVKSDQLGHCFVETGNFFLDSWSYGPPVFKEDAAFKSEDNDEKRIISKEEGKKTVQESDNILANMSKDDFFEQNLNEMITSIIEFSMINIEMWPQTSVLNDRLINIIESKSRARLQTRLIEVNNQIHAHGVIRSFAKATGNVVSIKDAELGCEKVLRAFNTRFMKNYIGQWHSK